MPGNRQITRIENNGGYSSTNAHLICMPFLQILSEVRGSLFKKVWLLAAPCPFTLLSPDLRIPIFAEIGY